MSVDSEDKVMEKKTRLKQGGVIRLPTGPGGPQGPAFTTHRIRIPELGIRFRRQCHEKRRRNLRKDELFKCQLRIPELPVRFRRQGYEKDNKA